MNSDDYIQFELRSLVGFVRQEMDMTLEEATAFLRGLLTGMEQEAAPTSFSEALPF